MALGQACSKHVQACASMPFSRQSQVKTKAQACASMHKLAKRFQMHACASLHRQARSKRATSMPQAWTSLPKGSKCILAQACKRSMHMLAASLQNKLAILVWGYQSPGPSSLTKEDFLSFSLNVSKKQMPPPPICVYVKQMHPQDRAIFDPGPTF